MKDTDTALPPPRFWAYGGVATACISSVRRGDPAFSRQHRVRDNALEGYLKRWTLVSKPTILLFCARRGSKSPDGMGIKRRQMPRAQRLTRMKLWIRIIGLDWGKL